MYGVVMRWLGMVAVCSSIVLATERPVEPTEGRSLVTGIDSVIGAVHSRLRSVFGTRREIQRKSQKTSNNFDDFKVSSFSFPDYPEPIRRSRAGTGNPSATRFLKKAKKSLNGRRKNKKRKLPKIFLTKFPLDELQDPEIFFTKIIKDNESSVEILSSDLSHKDLEALANNPALMYEEVRVYKDETNVIIEEEDKKGVYKKVNIHENEKEVLIKEEEQTGPVIRSNLIYQDGLRNVNAMIFNSQTVEEKGSRTESSSSKHYESSTFAPRLESVSSTAMVFQELCDDCEDQVYRRPADEDTTDGEVTEAEEIEQVASPQAGWWREDDWVLPILILASATLVLLLVFQVLLLVRSVKGGGTSRCTRLMSQLLLTGLLACATIAFLYTLAPTRTSCALIRFGSGLSYSIVYSTLLVKLVFLICLNSGIYLTSAYQGILLFFAVLIQLAIGIQGLVADPPNLSLTQECLSNFEQQLLGNLYNVFLIVLVTLLSLKFRGVRQNYREALYIGFAMGLNTTVWVFWVLTGLVVPGPYRDLCSSAGILASALVTFTVMFLPKGRQLAMGPDKKIEFYTSQESRDSTVNLSTLSLFSGHEGTGSLLCCPLLKLFNTRQQERHIAAQTAAVSSFLNRAFGKPPHTNGVAVSSSLDGSIYSTAEDAGATNPGPGDKRTPYRAGLGGKVLSSATSGPDGEPLAPNVYQLNNNYDRFPFSSRPPQFVPGGSQASPPNLYKMDPKTLLKSKPSVSNPNVLFCTPEDMTGTIIY